MIEIKAFCMIYLQFEVKTLIIMFKCQFSILGVKSSILYEF